MLKNILCFDFTKTVFLIFMKRIKKLELHLVNPLSANSTKWSNTLKQFVDNFPTNCLSVFDHFVILALKGLNIEFRRVVLSKIFIRKNYGITRAILFSERRDRNLPFTSTYPSRLKKTPYIGRTKIIPSLLSYKQPLSNWLLWLQFSIKSLILHGVTEALKFHLHT